MERVACQSHPLLSAVMRNVRVPIILGKRSVTSTTLLNTVRLGIHCFNPHRFNGVLKAATNELELPQEEFAQYLQSGEKCFKNPMNLKLMNSDAVVNSLSILQREFPNSEVYSTLIQSLVDSIDSEERLVELVIILEREGFLDERLLKGMRGKLDLVKSLRNRIRVAHLSPGPVGYLAQVLRLSGPELLKSGLTEVDLATVLSVCGTELPRASQETMIDCIEVMLRRRLSVAALEVDRVKVLHLIAFLSREGSPALMKAMESVVAETLQDQLDLLSPTQSIDLLEAFPPNGAVSRTLWINLQWRISRDPSHLRSLDSDRTVKMIKCMGLISIPSESIRTVLQRLAEPIQSVHNFKSCDQVCSLVDAFNSVGGNPWLEFIDTSELVFARTRQALVGPTDLNIADVQRALLGLVDGMALTDYAGIGNLVEDIKFSTKEEKDALILAVRDRIDQVPSSGARVGNLLLWKFMSKESVNFTKLVKSVRITGSIPLHADLSDLGVLQLTELASISSTEGRLMNLEMINDAALARCDRESVENLLELLAGFSDAGYPSRGLVDAISSRKSELTPNELLDFIQICAAIRCRPHCGVLDSHALAGQSADQLAVLIESLSSLGLLVDDILASRLLSAFATSPQQDRSPLSSRVLASMLISLKIPSEKQLSVLISDISANPDQLSDMDRWVISEFPEDVALPSPLTLSADPTIPVRDAWVDKVLPQFSDSPTRPLVQVGKSPLSIVDLLVNGDTAVMIARPEVCMASDEREYTQLFKFRVYLAQQKMKIRNVEIKHWLQI